MKLTAFTILTLLPRFVTYGSRTIQKRMAGKKWAKPVKTPPVSLKNRYAGYFSCFSRKTSSALLGAGVTGGGGAGGGVVIGAGSSFNSFSGIILART